MNCEQARQAWHDARDGGASDADAATHVGKCTACRAYVEQMSAIDGLLSDLRLESEGVVSGREPRPGRLQRCLPRRRAWLAAAMIAAAVGLGWMTFNLKDRGVPRIVERGLPARPVPPGGLDLHDAARFAGDGVGRGRDAQVVLVGETSHRYLAARAETTQPGVTLYWLYPTLPVDEAGGAS